MRNQLPFSASNSNASSLLTTSRKDPSTKSSRRSSSPVKIPQLFIKSAFSPYSPHIPASQPSPSPRHSHVILRNFHIRDPEAEPLSASSNSTTLLLPPGVIIPINSQDSIPDHSTTHLSHQIARFRNWHFPASSVTLRHNHSLDTQPG